MIRKAGTLDNRNIDARITIEVDDENATIYGVIDGIKQDHDTKMTTVFLRDGRQAEAPFTQEIEIDVPAWQLIIQDIQKDVTRIMQKVCK